MTDEPTKKKRTTKSAATTATKAARKPAATPRAKTAKATRTTAKAKPTAVRRTRKTAAPEPAAAPEAVAPEPAVRPIPPAEAPAPVVPPAVPPPPPVAEAPVSERWEPRRPEPSVSPDPVAAVAASATPSPSAAPVPAAPAGPPPPAWEPMPGAEEPQRRPDRPRWRDRFPRRDRGRFENEAPAAAPEPAEGIEGPSVQRLEPVPGEGLLEVSGKGFGFLREPSRNFVQSPQDVFVTPELVRRYGLRDGLWIAGDVRRGPRGPQLLRITAINGEDPEKCRYLPVFEELTCLNPIEWIRLETVPDRYTTRVIDLMAPIGKGQRGLIVAPPRTGKTTLLQHMAEAVLKNYPEMKLMILLVDERPEEVTEIRRSVPGAEILASSNDSDLKSHTRIAQLAIDRARRLVECGKDVFLLLDSITRVARAFNNAMAHGGRTMSGGVDARAMEIPRRLFAAARNTDEAGSLTIMGTALVQTGSKADELIFQEFKGTGNMELVLDRQISEQRVYPAVDIFASGTRREELLLPAHYLEKISVIRRGLSGHRPIEAIERLLSFLKKFPTNEQMLTSIPSA